MPRRTLVGAVLAAFLVIAAAGCGPSGATVNLTLSASAEGRTVTIAGETDLPDGTWLCYELRSPGDVTLFSDGLIQVQGGRYERQVVLEDWPPGRVEVWLAFQTILGSMTEGSLKQPPEIIEKFGELGENLVGDNVTKAGEMKRVELTAVAEIGG